MHVGKPHQWLGMGIPAIVVLSCLAMPAVAISASSIEPREAPQQFILATQLINQADNPTSIQKGVKWLEQASKQNYAPALFELASLYEQGNYVTADMSKAFDLYEQAAKQGNRDAQYNLGILYLRKPHNLKLAQYWLEQAAKQKDLEAMYDLALFHDSADGKSANPQLANFWYTKAAELGFRTAQFELGVRYLQGAVLEKDTKKAAWWAAFFVSRLVGTRARLSRRPES